VLERGEERVQCMPGVEAGGPRVGIGQCLSLGCGVVQIGLFGFEEGEVGEGRHLSVLQVSNSPFAPSGSSCLNFKLPVESSPQSQPL